MPQEERIEITSTLWRRLRQNGRNAGYVLPAALLLLGVRFFNVYRNDAAAAVDFARLLLLVIAILTAVALVLILMLNTKTTFVLTGAHILKVEGADSRAKIEWEHVERCEVQQSRQVGYEEMRIYGQNEVIKISTSIPEYVAMKAFVQSKVPQGAIKTSSFWGDTSRKGV